MADPVRDDMNVNYGTLFFVSCGKCMFTSLQMRNKFKMQNYLLY